jgi:hypothetical protein
MMSPGSSVGALLSGFKNTYGIQGFFTQGLAPEVSRATLMRGLKFTLYPAIHQKVYGKPVSEGTTKTKLAAACLTSIPEVLIIMPLEVSKVILTTDSTKQLGNSMFRAMNHAVKTKGLSSLMTGYIGVQYRQMSWGAGYFCSIGPFKKLAESALGKERKVTNDLLSGFAAGVFGAMLNTPGDTVRSVVMKRAFAAAPGTAPPQFFAVAKEIIKEKGAASLYSGFGFKAMHLGGGGALMALLVPQAKAVIIKQQKKRKNVV